MNVHQAFTKGIFSMVIHKYSHVVQNIFVTVCVYPSFSVHEVEF